MIWYSIDLHEFRIFEAETKVTCEFIVHKRIYQIELCFCWITSISWLNGLRVKKMNRKTTKRLQLLRLYEWSFSMQNVLRFFYDIQNIANRIKMFCCTNSVSWIMLLETLRMADYKNVWKNDEII